MKTERRKENEEERKKEKKEEGEEQLMRRKIPTPSTRSQMGVLDRPGADQSDGCSPQS